MAVVERLLSDAPATEALGAQLAACCRDRLLIFLNGELGAGKTTLVRGLLRALGYTGAVKSPTYTLVESYSLARQLVHHLDLYRLADADGLEWIGMRDLLADDALCLIEWPERGAALLPTPDLEIRLDYRESGRHAVLSAFTDAGRRVVDCLEKATVTA